MPRLLALVLTLALAACSGGSPSGDPAAFLAADARGIGAMLSDSSGVTSSPGTADPLGADPNASATEPGDDVARAIEEADLYRVSGDLLYLLNAWRGLVIVDLRSLTIIGRLPMRGVPTEVYLRGSRALVLLDGTSLMPGAGGELVEVDVNDPTAPVVRRRAALDGAFRTSRLVGDVLYTVSTSAAQSFSIATSPFAPIASAVLRDGAQYAHATDTRLFVTADTGSGETSVTVIDTGSGGGAMTPGGQVRLRGYLDADTKLHYGNGALRVVTFDWNSTAPISRLHTIDVSDPANPFVLAELPLARGEQLFGTRFTEHRAYIVTFERIDPLWIIDLSDPADPRITAELLVPGFSTQVVADGDVLLTLGFDPAVGDGPVVSLFDVADPAQPFLASRIGLGSSWSDALYDRKGFTVLDDRVLVPVFEGLAVVDRGPSTLSLRGTVAVRGGGQRGFAHGSELVAFGPEQVVVTDGATLVPRGQVTVARNVIDVARLGDGRQIELVASGATASVGGVDLPLWPERMFVRDRQVAVAGWDEQGRAVQVVDFATAPPRVSERIAVGWGGFAVPSLPTATHAGPPGVMAADMAFLAPVSMLDDEVITEDGWLVLHGVPQGPSHTLGSGELTDGLCVIDLATGRAGRGVRVRGGAITGLTTTGGDLVFTIARDAGTDAQARPLVRHDAFRLEPERSVLRELGNVPGFVVSADGDRLTTLEETWSDSWMIRATLVAVKLDPEPVIVTRLSLHDGAHGFRVAGRTLCYRTSSPSIFTLPATTGTPAGHAPALRVVHLSNDGLVPGPELVSTDVYHWLLAIEDGALLLARDDRVVERVDVRGATAIRDFAVPVDGHPHHARHDPLNPGRYLLALGYADMAIVP